MEYKMVFENSTPSYRLSFMVRDDHISWGPSEIPLHEMVYAMILRRMYDAYSILLRTYAMQDNVWLTANNVFRCSRVMRFVSDSHEWCSCGKPYIISFHRPHFTLWTDTNENHHSFHHSRLKRPVITRCCGVTRTQGADIVTSFTPTVLHEQISVVNH